ncbi:MAG: hypothetical protein U5O39_10575 [Gammaproteobacteria bacterium]|nr:hypothetical protein [Gammaproteobacteria bacterium]
MTSQEVDQVAGGLSIEDGMDAELVMAGLSVAVGSGVGLGLAVAAVGAIAVMDLAISYQQS